MERIVALIFVIAVVFCGCGEKSENRNYMNITGYKEYVSDCDSGMSGMKYFDAYPSMEESEKAVEYYKADSRVSGPFIITDYLDGICINKCTALSGEVNIPETIEGRKVIKIGSYYKYMGEYDSSVHSAFAGIQDCIVNIPSSVKYIEGNTLLSFSGLIEDENIAKLSPDIIKVNVDEDNPYYSSSDGVLYNKKGDTLLFVDLDNQAGNNWTFEVPDDVRSFRNICGVPCDFEGIRFGRNIKKIDTYVDYGDGGCEPLDWYKPRLTIKGYKNTAAQKWARKWYLKFEAIE